MQAYFRLHARSFLSGEQSLYRNNYYSSSQSLTVSTEGATNIGGTSAQLNSLIINGGNGYSQAWFEWGPTPFLGYQTVSVPVGNSPEVEHADMLSGLRPNTVYYFRAVAENSRWRNIGSTLTFVTGYGGVNPTGGGTNTIIIREPIYIQQAPTPATDNSNTNTTLAETNSSAQSSNAIGGGLFFPQTLLSWTILLVFVLILLVLAKRIYQPKLVASEHSDHA